MNEALVSILAAIIGLLGGLLGGYFAGRQQRSLEYEKWLRAREDDLAKETRLAVAELTRKLSEATHSMAWLTWKAKNQSVQLTKDDIFTYDKEMHGLFAAISGSLAVVSALNFDMYEKVDPLVRQVYAIDTRITLSASHFIEKSDLDVKEMADCFSEVHNFDRVLNQNVAGIMSGTLK
jgi:uncharacterized protein YneF (UPF0154 family)